MVKNEISNRGLNKVIQREINQVSGFVFKDVSNTDFASILDSLLPIEANKKLIEIKEELFTLQKEEIKRLEEELNEAYKENRPPLNDTNMISYYSDLIQVCEAFGKVLDCANRLKAEKRKNLK